jgi:hypothetical protein
VGLIRVHLGHPEGKAVLVVIHQVPCVSGKPALHVFQEPPGAEKMQLPFPAQDQPQERIESDEVIHVGMGDEYMAELQQIPGRQGMDISQVEQTGAFTEEKGNKEAGVVKRTVHQPGMIGGAHQEGMNLLTCLLMQK